MPPTRGWTCSSIPTARTRWRSSAAPSATPGQGSSTSFTLASHTPNDAKQEKEWKERHDWESIHHWDFPMLSNRFVESSCVKCHHQMTDLIRHGAKEEAPKLLRGYNLVKENGCFGCHEISGIKAGRSIGPDLRLEATPALEYLSAADQEKAQSDPANPPGTLRKVGPSLRRIAEKTNEDWTRKWVQSPRGFRPDTKMPHFYGLSTNDPKCCLEDQKNFPATEIHGIAHYLLAESKGNLEGKDFYREALLAGKHNVNALQGELVKTGLPDKDAKELFDVSKRFTDVALLSAPRMSRQSRRTRHRQRQLQERIAELQKRIADLKAKGDCRRGPQADPDRDRHGGKGTCRGDGVADQRRAADADRKGDRRRGRRGRQVPGEGRQRGQRPAAVHREGLPGLPLPRGHDEGGGSHRRRGRPGELRPRAEPDRRQADAGRRSGTAVAGWCSGCSTPTSTTRGRACRSRT